MVISAAFGIAGMVMAWFLYVARPALAESLKTSLGPLYTLVANKYYVDEIYQALSSNPLKAVRASFFGVASTKVSSIAAS